jgi:type IV pilus assembly protein PilN
MRGLNLLPWREQFRVQRKQQFLFIWGSSIFGALLIVLLIHGIIANKISNQKSINPLFQNEISIYNKTIIAIQDLKARKVQMIERLNLIHELQASRHLTVKFYDEMVRIVPRGVYLYTLKREQNNVLLQGKAESNTEVSELMRNIEKSKCLGDPVLSEIKQDLNDEYYQRKFTLKLKLIDRYTHHELQ